MLIRGCLALIVAAGLVGVSARGQTPLAWKFKKDDAFRFETVSTLKQIMKLLDKDGKPEGKEIVQDIEYTIVVGYKVLDVTKDGDVLLEMKVESMKFKNSAAFAAAIVADEKIQNATLKITLNAKREVTKLDGHDEFLKKMAGEDSNVLKTLQLVLPKEALLKSAREAFGFLPDKPEKTWTREVNTPMGPLGDLAIKNTYTAEGAEQVDGKTLEKITYDSAISYSPPNAQAPGVAQSAFRVVKGELKRDDKNKGTIQFDAAAGRLVTMNQQIKLKGKLSLLVQGSRIDAEVDQDQKTKTTLVK
ncbi:MAG TPA: hypothetical protein VKE94_16155 [Gemmataceae bacterium]|nr:hypothetical protein [Gemmataceae bacterium]